MTQFQRVTIYADDDVTVLTTLSTDPTHIRPWLKRIENLGEASIDFVEGRSTIGQMSFKAIDKRTIATDQDSGYLTNLIATNKGLLGNRVLVEQQRVGSATYYKVFNGVITDHPLNDTLVTYSFALRDVHERVRTSRLFGKLKGMTLLPVGVELGYGYSEANNTYLIPPTVPLRGVFWRDPFKPTLAGRVKLDLKVNQSLISYDFYKVMQTKFGQPRELFNEITGLSLGTFYPGVTIKWRPYPGGGAWTTWDGSTMPFVRDTDYLMTNVFPVEERIFDLAEKKIFAGLIGDVNILVNFTKPAGGTLPTHQQQIEVIVLANGEPSEDLPQFVDDNFGDLLEKVVTGYWDRYPIGVTLNATALAAMKLRTKRARTVITAPIDGEGAPKKWIEENIYKPNGYAPQINDEGEIVPLKWELPDVNAPILEITDAIVRKDAKWTLTDADAVNVILFEVINEYLREPRVNGELPFRRYAQSKQTDVDGTVASIAKLGLKEVAYKQTTVRSLADSRVFGGGDSSLGARLRAERKAQVRDRFSRGAQRITAYCRRSATGIQTAQEGDWCQVSISWLPEFGTGRRGTNRLMQIVKIREDSLAFRGFELLDAGEFAQPVGQPTLGAASVDVSGYVTIPVATIPAGVFARVDYAISAGQPDTNSGLWQFGGRRDTVGNIVIGPIPSNTTVWYRARGEKEGSRRSGWTAAVSLAVGYILTAYDVRIEVTNGVPTVFFKVTTGVDDTFIYYDIHPYDPDFVGGLASQISATPAEGLAGKVLPEVLGVGEDITVQVQAWRLSVGYGYSPRISWLSIEDPDLDVEQAHPFPPMANITRSSITAPTLTTETVKFEGEIGVGGVGPIEWRYRTIVDRDVPGAWSAWDPAFLPVEAAISRNVRWPKVVELQTKQGDGQISTASYLVESRMEAVDESTGRLDDDIVMDGGFRPFGRGQHTSPDVVETAARNFVANDNIDVARRVVSAYRGGIHEPATNMFKRGSDTASDVIITTTRSFVDPATATQVDSAGRIIGVYRFGVFESVNNLMKTGDAISDSNLSANIARLNTTQTWTARQRFAAPDPNTPLETQPVSGNIHQAFINGAGNVSKWGFYLSNNDADWNLYNYGLAVSNIRALGAGGGWLNGAWKVGGTTAPTGPLTSGLMIMCAAGVTAFYVFDDNDPGTPRFSIERSGRTTITVPSEGTPAGTPALKAITHNGANPIFEGRDGTTLVAEIKNSGAALFNSVRTPFIADQGLDSINARYFHAVNWMRAGIGNTGYVRLVGGDATHAGYIDWNFWNGSTWVRNAYMGFDSIADEVHIAIGDVGTRRFTVNANGGVLHGSDWKKNDGTTTARTIACVVVSGSAPTGSDTAPDGTIWIQT